MTNSSDSSRKKLDPKLIAVLLEIGGEQCVNVATELYNIETNEITDDHLAEICDIKLNIVRKILYILYGHKLAVFRKLRDKKSGWFIYYWHESFSNLKELIKLKQQQVLEKLSLRLMYEEENVFYLCNKPKKSESDILEANQKPEKPESDIPEANQKPEKPESDIPEANQKPENLKCGNMTTFEEAMEENFKCVKCGGNLTHFNNERVKEFLREKIAILRQSIKSFT